MTTKPGCAIVIGHGPGVGDATARAFVAEGHAAALIARDGERAKAAAFALGGGSQGFAADASREDQLVAALEAARASLGDPAIVVYNAAFWRPGPVLSISAAMAEEDYRTCLVGALVAARWAAPFMRARGAGSLLFTGGGLAMYPSSDAPTLSIGKGAIRALALMLADELAPHGLRAGTVTIAGVVGAKGIPPERIADAFIKLHRGTPGRAHAEIVLKG